MSEDVFRAAQDAMYEIKKRYPPHRGKSAEAKTKSHWLTGLVRCGTCGGAMVNSNGYFVCNGYVRGKCTERNAIHKDVLSEIVLTKLKQDFHKTHTFAYAPPKKAPQENVETGISHLTLRLARAKDAYLAGVDTLEEYTENKTWLTAALETEKNRLSRLSGDAPAGFVSRSVFLPAPAVWRWSQRWAVSEIYHLQQAKIAAFHRLFLVLSFFYIKRRPAVLTVKWAHPCVIFPSVLQCRTTK